MNRKQFIATAAGAVVHAADKQGNYPEQLSEIYPVPPLARKNDAKRSINFPENEKLFKFLRQGGVTRFVYAATRFCTRSRWPNTPS